jgi:hypothetical protein
MIYYRHLVCLIFFLLSGCKVVGAGSYQVPANAETSRLFIYTPDTKQKNADGVLVYIDKLTAGEVSENRPLQLPVTTGWHKIVVNRKSALGPKEELGKIDLLVEKDKVYYLRYTKKPSTFETVEENVGRQMQ